jgi:hypothetical protein
VGARPAPPCAPPWSRSCASCECVTKALTCARGCHAAARGERSAARRRARLRAAERQERVVHGCARARGRRSARTAAARMAAKGGNRTRVARGVICTFERLLRQRAARFVRVQQPRKLRRAVARARTAAHCASAATRARAAQGCSFKNT